MKGQAAGLLCLCRQVLVSLRHALGLPVMTRQRFAEAAISAYVCPCIWALRLGKPSVSQDSIWGSQATGVPRPCRPSLLQALLMQRPSLHLPPALC